MAAGSTETIPLITNVATDKVTKHTQVKFTEPPRHRHMFCCGQNPPHILTHRGPIGRGGKFAQLWPPFFPYVHMTRTIYLKARWRYLGGGGGGGL